MQINNKFGNFRSVFLSSIESLPRLNDEVKLGKKAIDCDL